MALTIAAEEAIVLKMLEAAPDDVLEARKNASKNEKPRSSEAHVIGLREFGCAPIAFVKECPTGESNTDPIYHGVWNIMNRVQDVKALAEQVGKDRHLSDEGRAAKLASGWARVRESLNQLTGVLVAEAPQIDAIEKQVLSVPAIEPSDAAKALQDVEIRRWFTDLTPEARIKYAQEMYAGQHEDVIAALVRSPIPGVTREFAKAAWRAVIERKEPQRVQGISKRRDRLEWAKAAARCVEDRMSQWQRNNSPQPRAA